MVKLTIAKKRPAVNGKLVWASGMVNPRNLQGRNRNEWKNGNTARGTLQLGKMVNRLSLKGRYNDEMVNQKTEMMRMGNGRLTSAAKLSKYFERRTR